MKRIFLITLATTISTLATENPQKRGNPEAEVYSSPMMAKYDNGSKKQRNALPQPDMKAFSEVLYLNRFSEKTVIGSNVGILDMTKVNHLTVTDIELLSKLCPDLKVLYINGQQILGSNMKVFIKAFAENFPSLITLGIEYVRGIAAGRLEAYAQQYSWNATISRNPPRR